MPWVDLLFVSLLKLFVISFLVLATCQLALKWFRQPIERIRLIQITFIALFAAFLLSHFSTGRSWWPTVDLAIMPSANEPIADELALERHSSAPATPPALESQPPVVVSQGNSTQTALPPTPGSASVGFDPAPPTVGMATNSQTSTEAIGLFAILKVVFVATFLLAGIVQIAYLAVGILMNRRLIQSGTEINGDHGRLVKKWLGSIEGHSRVRVLQSDWIDVPVATGILYPTILLPTKFLKGKPDDELVKQSLAHEWMHVRRNDLLTWQLVGVCQVLLWPQPFYWSLRRELRVSQDQIADQFAARMTNEIEDYAETLLTLSKTRHANLSGSLTMAGSKSNLYRRVEMLLNPNFILSNVSRRSVLVGFTACVTVIGLLLATIQLTNAATFTENESNPVVDEEKSSDDETKGEKRDYSGVVIDASTGDPIAGATVILTLMNSSTWEEVAVNEYTTNDKGEYSFVITPEQDAEKYLYLMFDLKHDTYAPRHCGSYAHSMIKKNMALGAQQWFERLTMVAGAKITGRVVDKAGKPVEGAKVHLTSQAPTEDPFRDFSGSSFTKTDTGKDGRFEAIVTAEGIARLSIIPHAHAMKYMDVGSDRGDLGDVTVDEGISIRGQVLDAVGNKVEGVWVNLSEADTNNEGAWEMHRSAKTDSNGEFQTRPLKPGNYTAIIETKATGALEKDEYANFHDDPTDDVFVRRVIEVTEGSVDQPFVIQAVPHIYIKGQCYNSKGEKARCHMPNVMGTFDGQLAWIRSVKGDEVGSFVMKVPHGIENARLDFMTNEHSCLTVQFGDGAPSTERTYEYEKIEEDITGIKVVRYVAPILQVKVVDEDGKQVNDAGITLRYKDGPEPDPRLVGPKTNVFFEKQDNDVFRSSQLAPNLEFDVYATKEGSESEHVTMTMEEGKDKLITVTLKPTDAKSKDGEAEMKMKDKDDK